MSSDFWNFLYAPHMRLPQSCLTLLRISHRSSLGALTSTTYAPYQISRSATHRSYKYARTDRRLLHSRGDIGPHPEGCKYCPWNIHQYAWCNRKICRSKGPAKEHRLRSLPQYCFSTGSRTLSNQKVKRPRCRPMTAFIFPLSDCCGEGHSPQRPFRLIDNNSMIAPAPMSRFNSSIDI